jgi:hypothetical protein
MWLQPFVDDGDVKSGLVTDGELVVSGCDRTITLEAVDRALHSVAFAVVDRIELRWPAATRAASDAVGGLVLLLRDGALDPAPAQVGTVSTGGVGLIGADPIRAGTRAATTGTRHPDAFQHRPELRGIAPLPGGDHQRQRLLPVLDGQMHLGGQPAP